MLQGAFQDHLLFHSVILLALLLLLVTLTNPCRIRQATLIIDVNIDTVEPPFKTAKLGMCGQSRQSTDRGVEGPSPQTTLTRSSAADTGQAFRAYTPETALCYATLDLMISSLSLPIVHHSLRVYQFANWLMEKENSEYVDKELLFIACVCHDLGASSLHDGLQRFEVEGADAAARLMRMHGKSEAEIHEVWTAIALHTSPGIAERITVMARYVRLGVLIDFEPETRKTRGAAFFGVEIESKWPRLEIEKILGDTVVAQAVRNPEKAPKASWPGDLYKSYLENPEWPVVNRAF